MRVCPCGASFEGRGRQVWCSKACRQRIYRAEHPAYVERQNELGRERSAARYQPAQAVERKCAVCSATFLGRPNGMLCSNTCQNRARRASKAKRGTLVAEKARAARRYAERYPEKVAERSRDTARRRRARVRGAELGRNFSGREVAERDGNRCHLCGGRVNLRLKHPHPRSASLDHLVPLALGGSHELANVRLAHLDCNVSKGTRAMGEQLLLIG